MAREQGGRRESDAGAPAVPIRLSELVSALSYALDLVEGQPAGHSVRTCVLGLRIGERLGLDRATLRDLYFALLLKDAGCSNNATRLCQIIGGDEIRAKRGVKTTDWTKLGWESLCYAWQHVALGQPFWRRMARISEIASKRVPRQREVVLLRCERGAEVARQIGFSEATAAAIHCLDEHWDGRGYPDSLRGAQIPLLSRILSVSQTLEVHWSSQGADQALEVARHRNRKWFDPELVETAEGLAKEGGLWQGLDGDKPRKWLLEREPPEDAKAVTRARLDSICEGFAGIVDAKSPYTYRHSLGVAAAAESIARELRLTPQTVDLVRRAGMLHDIGKLSVPNSILEKPGHLEAAEWNVIRKHPYYTRQILSRVEGFQQLCHVAAHHHEKLDGSGYFWGLPAEHLSLADRILAVADIYDALAAKRPYREALPPAEVLAIIEKESPAALDPDCVCALRSSMGDTTGGLLRLQSAIEAEAQDEQHLCTRIS